MIDLNLYITVQRTNISDHLRPSDLFETGGPLDLQLLRYVYSLIHQVDQQ